METLEKITYSLWNEGDNTRRIPFVTVSQTVEFGLRIDLMVFVMMLIGLTYFSAAWLRGKERKKTHEDA